MAHASRVQAAEAFVKQKLANHDSSHDWWHIHRVRNMTVRLSDHLSVGRWVAVVGSVVGGWRADAGKLLPVAMHSYAPIHDHIIHDHTPPP